jgi:putative ABC transport system permease protein
MVTVATLVFLAAVNATLITWTTVLDNRHATAVARALGATPQQVSSSLPPFWQFAAVVVVAVVVIALLTAIPARVGGRRPVAEILQSEQV